MSKHRSHAAPRSGRSLRAALVSVVGCTNGDGDLVRYDALFARQGGEITEGDRESAPYQQASEDCR